LVTIAPYVDPHGELAKLQVHLDYDHYHLGSPGAVGHALSVHHCHPIAGGAVSSFAIGTKSLTPPLSVRLGLS